MTAWHRLVVPAISALAIAVAVPFLWLADPVDGFTIVLALWQAAPFGVLLLFRRKGFSDVGTLLTGVVLGALALWGYAAIRSSDSSTAAIGYLYVPGYLMVVVVLALFVDLGVRHIAGRFLSGNAEAS